MTTTVLAGDVATAVRALKARPGRELQVHGSGTLIRWLLDNDLVDEINLFLFPVVVGQGTRLFPKTGPDTALDPVESRATPRGVTIQIYRPDGRAQYGTSTTDLKHVKIDIPSRGSDERSGPPDRARSGREGCRRLDSTTVLTQDRHAAPPNLP